MVLFYVIDQIGLFYIRDYMVLFYTRDSTGLFYIRDHMMLFCNTDYMSESKGDCTTSEATWDSYT